MQNFKQVAAVTGISLRGLPQRWGTSCIIVIGIAAVVAVLVSVLAAASSLRESARNTGRADRAIVLRGGSAAELGSILSRDQATTIMDAPEVLESASGEPVASPEAVLTVVLPTRDGSDANFTLRGVGPQILAVRPEVRIIEGRMFRPQVREIIVGRSIRQQSVGLEVGSTLNLHGTDWTIVGVFESGGDWHESELMAPAVALLIAYQRFGFQSVTVRLTSAAAFGSFKDALSQNPSLSVSVQRESDYYEQVSGQLSSTLFVVAYVIGSIMGVGALFGAVNCLYSAVITRVREIATVRAIGFGGGAVVASVFIESLVLALIGGALGCAASWLVFNGATAKALGSLNSLSQVVFNLSVSPAAMATGVAVACGVGLMGALFPAVAAARAPVAEALRRV